MSSTSTGARSRRRATCSTSRVFVAYFPHLVAGPILRASRLLPQIDRPRRITAEQMRDGLWLIAWGLFQKIFVADNLAPLANAGIRSGRPPHRHQCAARHLRVRLPDLRRLRRLLEHRARHVEADGDRAHRELPLPVPRVRRRRSSGGTGTSACPPGCATTCTSRSAAIADRPAGPAATCSSRWCSAGCGTAPPGRSCSGACITASLLIAYRAAGRMPFAQRLGQRGRSALARATSWVVMFHLTCYGWLIFRARSASSSAP